MVNTTMDREDLAQLLATELQIARFRDYCPNGLQVEGRRAIKKIVTGVTACQALLAQAIAANADAILVHHGYFWRGEDMRVIGQKQRRLKCLLENELSLFAYHLPLDAHPELGNNAQLGRRLSLQASGRFGEDDLGWLGEIQKPEITTLAQLKQHIETQLGRSALAIGEPEQKIGRIAWCTGAAQNMLGAAIEAGATVFLSGEISEPTVHLAREAGVAYIACGHHATERYGILALGTWLAQKHGLIHEFIDIDNPV